MTEQNSPKAVVRAIIDARERGDIDAALELIAPESVDQGRPATRADWRAKWAGILAGSPDFQVITEHSITDDEWVSNRYTIRGTHTGDFFGAPPTGKRFETSGMDMVRVRDGRLVEHWTFSDPF
jgi:predicted ester cyclase